MFLSNCDSSEWLWFIFVAPAFSNELMEGPIDEVREEPPQDGFDNLVMVIGKGRQLQLAPYWGATSEFFVEES